MFKTVGSVKRTRPALPIDMRRSARVILGWLLFVANIG